MSSADANIIEICPVNSQPHGAFAFTPEKIIDCTRLAPCIIPRMQGDPQLREGTITAIQDVVARMFGLSVGDLQTESRARNVALPRQIAMYVAKQLTDASLPEIGRQFGGKHHTSVMHSIARIHQLRATDAGIDNAVESVLERLRQQTGD
jgi:chromosomal replication initiation ATPase DnaA